MATPFEIPQHRYRYPQGDSLPLAPPEKRLRKRLSRAGKAYRSLASPGTNCTSSTMKPEKPLFTHPASTRDA